MGIMLGCLLGESGSSPDETAKELRESTSEKEDRPNGTAVGGLSPSSPTNAFVVFNG